MLRAPNRLLVILLLGACGPQPPEHELVIPKGDSLRLSRSVVADGRVHFYTFEEEGHRVNFLVRTDGEGRLHAHLDACYSCYRYKRGFVVENDDLLCIACRLTYPIEDEIWDFQGACAPIPIPFSLDAENLVIRRKTLERASRYF